MKITDLKCAVIGRNPVVRVVTDEGISGYGEIESSKPYVKPQVLFYKDLLLGQDPTDVERAMLRIRRAPDAVALEEGIHHSILGGQRAGMRARCLLSARRTACLEGDDRHIASSCLGC